MTDKKRAALQAALEAMEYLESQPHVRGKNDCYEDLIGEIRAALAESEVEPVAYLIGMKSSPDKPYHSKTIVWPDQITLSGTPAHQAVQQVEGQITEVVSLVRGGLVQTIALPAKEKSHD